MSIKDIFRKSPHQGPEIVEKTTEKKKKALPDEVYDFAYNEHRFGRNTKTGAFIKTYPIPKSLYGFFDFQTEEISEEEYKMWQDCLENPHLYVITAENLGRGMKKFTISEKD